MATSCLPDARPQGSGRRELAGAAQVCQVATSTGQALGKYGGTNALYWARAHHTVRLLCFPCVFSVRSLNPRACSDPPRACSDPPVLTLPPPLPLSGSDTVFSMR